MKLITLAIALLVTGVAAEVAAASFGPRVGHTIEHVVVPGSAQGEPRKVDVHLWYPADRRGFAERPRTVYKSALNGRDREGDPPPTPWSPLSWTIDAEVAREGAPIDRNRGRIPVIVFSHGSVNDPIDYAYTLELIAGAGFVVAAPYHVNNSQEDVRIDFANLPANGGAGFSCNDGRPSPCSRLQVPFSMADRVRDISAVLDELPAWLGDRVDVSRAGVMGHSRGTVTALAAAGGSAPRIEGNPNCLPSGDDCWPLAREPRVKAIMGMAIGGAPITQGAGIANVDVPALLVAGARDQTSPQAVSRSAFEQLASREKAFLSITNAVHRSFDSTYCAQAQAAGAIAQGDPNAILDDHTYDGVVWRAGVSGRAHDYCSYETFTQPVDITARVEADLAVVPGILFDVTPDSVPSTGLDTDQVKRGMTVLATSFFGAALNGRPHLMPLWLEDLSMVGCARIVTRYGSITLPLDHEGICAPTPG
jgi:predicted dienelactone hydrolase